MKILIEKSMNIKLFLIFISIVGLFEWQFGFWIPKICNLIFIIFIILVCVLWNCEFVKKIRKNKFLIRIFCIIFSIYIFIYVFISILMINQILKTTPQNKTLIVLGCYVNGDYPSKMLKFRLDKAIHYLNNNANSICIVSGGQGVNELKPEATVMHDYLISQGISSHRIILEDQSSNTLQNIQNSKQLIIQSKLNNEVVVVTDNYHCLRSVYLCQKEGLEGYSFSSVAPFFYYSVFWTREVFALIKFFYFN